jgi:formylglycine-generating enzyme required for sulfatase activity
MKTAESSWKKAAVIFAILALAVLAVRMGDATAVSAQAAKTKVNPHDGLTYVWISPGTFQMGCSSDDSECGDEEKPAHSITITSGFWIGQTPVTQEAFKKVTGMNLSSNKGDGLPAEGISWNDAGAYCKSVEMRLPAEAEWEYAARGGSSSARYASLSAIAWYSDNSANAPHKVALKQANPYGLYDMLGNVWEWVADWYGGYTSANATDPHGPARGIYKVLRGGARDYAGSFIRVSYRFWDEPEDRGVNNGLILGFRCAAN